MASTKGRRVALWAAGIAVVTLVVAGVALRDRIREEWWLYELENGEDQATRAAAIRELQILGTQSSIPILIGEYLSGGQNRRIALETILAIGGEGLTTLLREERTRNGAISLDTLEAFHEAAATVGSGWVSELVAWLNEARGKERVAAIDAIMNLGRVAEEAMPALLMLRTEDDEEVRRLAAQAAGCIVRGEGTWILALEKMAVQGANTSERVWATQAIGVAALDLWLERGLAIILNALNDEAAVVRSAACSALRDAKAADLPGVITALAGVLERDGDPRVRQEAAETLGEYAYRRPEVGDALLRYLATQPLEAYQSVLLMSLRRFIGRRRDVELALCSLAKQSPYDKVRCYAISVLLRSEPPLERAATIDAARSTFRDSSEFVRRRALESLHGAPGRLWGKELLPDLQRCLDDTSADVVGAAVKALGFLGRDAASASDCIQSLMIQGRVDCRIAGDALLGIFGPSERLCAALVAGLRTGDEECAVACARYLGMLGDQATSVVPTLREAAETGSERVRLAAKESLLKIVSSETKS